MQSGAAMTAGPLKTQNTFSIGMLVALSSWGLIFVTLIWGYMAYRLRAASWLGDYLSMQVVAVAIANTLVMAVSSWFLSESFKRKNVILAWTALGLGIVFLLGQGYLWQTIMAQGLDWKKSVAGSFFFLLTGFHFIHILGALPALFVLCLKFDELSALTTGRGIRLFWDFLFFVWAVMFVVIFIIK